MSGSTLALQLQTCTADDATIVKCRGGLTAELTAILRAEVKKLIPHAKRIILTLITSMDSSRRGTVVGLYFSAKKADCDLQLINLSKRVRDLLGMTHLLSVFEACGRYMIKIP